MQKNVIQQAENAARVLQRIFRARQRRKSRNQRKSQPPRATPSRTTQPRTTANRRITQNPFSANVVKTSSSYIGANIVRRQFSGFVRTVYSQDDAPQVFFIEPSLFNGTALDPEFRYYEFVKVQDVVVEYRTQVDFTQQGILIMSPDSDVRDYGLGGDFDTVRRQMESAPGAVSGPFNQGMALRLSGRPKTYRTNQVDASTANSFGQVRYMTSGANLTTTANGTAIGGFYIRATLTFSVPQREVYQTRWLAASGDRLLVKNGPVGILHPTEMPVLDLSYLQLATGGVPLVGRGNRVLRATYQGSTNNGHLVLPGDTNLPVGTRVYFRMASHWLDTATGGTVAQSISTSFIAAIWTCNPESALVRLAYRGDANAELFLSDIEWSSTITTA